MHETEVGMPAELATARRKSALDEVPVLVLLAVTLPSPVMAFPQKTCEPSPGDLIASGSRRSGMLRLIDRLDVLQQANDGRSHPA